MRLQLQEQEEPIKRRKRVMNRGDMKPNSMRMEGDLARFSSSKGFLPKYMDIRQNLARTLHLLEIFRCIHGYLAKISPDNDVKWTLEENWKELSEISL